MATKKITATVNYPVYVQVEVDENMSNEDIEKIIIHESIKGIESGAVNPVIHDCSDPDLID